MRFDDDEKEEVCVRKRAPGRQKERERWQDGQGENADANCDVSALL